MIVDFLLVCDKTTGQSRGFGFATLACVDELHSFVDATNGAFVFGDSVAPISVSFAAPKKKTKSKPKEKHLPDFGGPRTMQLSKSAATHSFRKTTHPNHGKRTASERSIFSRK